MPGGVGSLFFVALCVGLLPAIQGQGDASDVSYGPPSWLLPLVGLGASELAVASCLLFRLPAGPLKTALHLGMRLAPKAAAVGVAAYSGSPVLATTCVAGPLTSSVWSLLASLLWSSATYTVPLPWHVPTVLLEALLLNAAGSASQPPAVDEPPPSLPALIIRLVCVCTATTIATVFVQTWRQQQEASKQRQKMRGVRRSSSGDEVAVQKKLARASFEASRSTLRAPGGASTRYAPAAAPTAAAAAVAAPAAEAPRVRISSAAQGMIEDMHASLLNVQPLTAASQEAMRSAAAAHVTALLGETHSSTAAVLGAPTMPGKYVPYRGMCTMTPVGIKVKTAGHEGFDAISSLLTSTLSGAANSQLAAAGVAAAPAVTSACVPGCVQLLGSVIHAAVYGSGGRASGSDDAGAGGRSLASSLAGSLKQPLGRLMAKQRQAMPAISITAADATLDLPAAPAAPAAAAATPAASEAAAAPAPCDVALLACQPPCLVQGQAATLRAMVQRPEGVAPVNARVVVFDAAGAVLLDQEAGQLGAGDSVLTIDTPAMASDVAQVALLLDGARMAFVQPLPVLPGAAAAELQQLWAAALTEAVSASAQGAAVPGDEITPATALDRAALTAALQSGDVAAAWQLHIVPLLTDLCYVLACQQSASASPAALPVVTSLLQHLASNGMYAVITQLVSVERRKQAEAAATSNTLSARAARSFRDLPVAAGNAAARGRAAVGALTAAVVQHMMDAWAGTKQAIAAFVAPRRPAAAPAAAPAPAPAASPFATAADEAGGEPSSSAVAAVGGMAATVRRRRVHPRRQSSLGCLLNGGFRSSAQEARYRAFVARMTPAMDYFAAFYHVAAAIVLLANYHEASGVSHFNVALGKLLTVAVHVVPSVCMLLLRSEITGATRNTVLAAWDAVLVVATWMVAGSAVFAMPPVIRKCYGESSLFVDFLIVISHGIIRPFYRQVPARHFVLASAGEQLGQYMVSCKYGMAPSRAAVRYLATWCTGLAVAATSERAMRRMFRNTELTRKENGDNGGKSA